jgi:hypothetical protein
LQGNKEELTSYLLAFGKSDQFNSTLQIDAK